MNILYVGPNPSQYAIDHRPGDAAAGKWSFGLLKGISTIAGVHVLCHAHERCWPKGDVFWRGSDVRLHPATWPHTAISYPSLYRIREMWLDWRYPKVANRLLSSGMFDTVLTYNCCYPYQVKVMREAAKFGVPSFPIVLDGDDPRKDDWKRILSDTRFATGIVFLSHWAKKTYPGPLPTFHMDGGAIVWRGGDAFRKPCHDGIRFVYSGALDRWRGLAFMREVAALLGNADSGIKIVICGKLDAIAKRIFSKMANVELCGFVSEAELDAISADADGFLNVRDPAVGDNILNFPSKVPQYLSWGKPIVSTWIDSFSPDYHNVLCVDAENTPASFAQKVIEVSKWSTSAFIDNFMKAKQWFNATRLWNRQAVRLVGWIKEVSDI